VPQVRLEALKAAKSVPAKAGKAFRIARCMVLSAHHPAAGATAAPSCIAALGTQKHVFYAFAEGATAAWLSLPPASVALMRIHAVRAICENNFIHVRAAGDLTSLRLNSMHRRA
jgi:hypothetical protein